MTLLRMTADIRRTIPTIKSLATLKSSTPRLIAAHTHIFRAAWNAASVLPVMANKFYRFGPPEAIITGSAPPYWWLYVAEKKITSVYEAQFCKNEPAFPGTFYLDPFAEKKGLIATIDFPTDLTLLDMIGDVLFQLGIFDQISSPDHAWCQWFGNQLVKAKLFQAGKAFDGILYPSRKNRSENAIALFSGFVDKYRGKIKHATQKFNTTEKYTTLRSMPFCKTAP